MKNKFLLIFFLSGIFIFPNIYGSNVSLSPHSKNYYTKFATIDVLVVIYSNTAGTKILPSDISKLKNGINLSREFIWRNSNCKLNLNLSFLEINEYKSKRFFSENGLLVPKFVENDFSAHGILQNQYGIIFLIFGPPQGAGNYGRMKILGDIGYSFFRFPCRTSVAYPGKNSWKHLELRDFPVNPGICHFIRRNLLKRLSRQKLFKKYIINPI